MAFTGIHAQDNAELDSLKKNLLEAAEDTNKVKTYLELGYIYQWTDPDSALLYALPGLALAKRIGYERGEYDLLLPVGEALALKGNYPQALSYRFRAVEIAKHTKKPVLIANALAVLGNIYSASKEYRKALEYLHQARQITAGDILGGPQVLDGLIGQAYFHSGEMDSALFYCQRAYEIDSALPDNHWSVPYQYLAAVYEKKGNLPKALALYRQSAVFNDNNSDKFRTYIGISSVFRQTGLIDSAIFYAKAVVRQGAALSIPAPVIEGSTQLVNLYKSLGYMDSAFKYQETVLAFKDSLFSQEKIKQMQNVIFDEQLREQRIATEKDKLRSRLKVYGLLAALALFLSIGIGLWRNNRSKQKANALLNIKNSEIESALRELKDTQSQLIQKEKMASLGEITAGIAHEIQNPLNFINNFSELNSELLVEIRQELNGGNIAEASNLLTGIKENEEKINHHGRRADSIIKGMLEHSRAGMGIRQPTAINALADEYMRLSYHGFRDKNQGFNATIDIDIDKSIGKINIVPQDIGRVLLNLYNNAFYATNEKKKTGIAGYEPAILLATEKVNDKIVISIKDNGNGISQRIADKIFQPFFTTKPTGQGTGLGLSLAYDIIKAHGGELKAENVEGNGAKFIIELPLN